MARALEGIQISSTMPWSRQKAVPTGQAVSLQSLCGVYPRRLHCIAAGNVEVIDGQATPQTVVYPVVVGDVLDCELVNIGANTTATMVAQW